MQVRKNYNLTPTDDSKSEIKDYRGAQDDRLHKTTAPKSNPVSDVKRINLFFSINTNLVCFKEKGCKCKVADLKSTVEN